MDHYDLTDEIMSSGEYKICDGGGVRAILKGFVLAVSALVLILGGAFSAAYIVLV